MGLAIPKQEITHKYAIDATDVSLSDADIDSVHITSPEISWTPPEKKSGAEVTPAT